MPPLVHEQAVGLKAVRAAILWARADGRRRWSALVALALLITLVVGTVVALLAGARRAGEALERYNQADQLPDVIVGAGSEATAALVEELRTDPRVARVERADMVVVAPAPMPPGNDGFTIVGSTEGVAGFFGRPRLVEGRYPDPSSPDEIVVNEEAAATYGFRSGQRVPLLALECYLCAGVPVGEATVVGVVRLVTDLTADPQISGVAIGSPAFMNGRWQDLLRPAIAYGVHVHDVAAVDSVVGELSVRVADGDVTDRRVASAPLERATLWQRNALVLAAGVVALSGLLVVVQALVRHLAGRNDDPQVLAALGLTTRELTVAGWLALLPAVVAGTVIALVVSTVLSPLLPLGVTRRVDPDVGMHADAEAFGAGALVALVLFLAASWLTAHRWARTATSRPGQMKPSVVGRTLSALGLRPVPATGARYALTRGEASARPLAVPSVAVLASAVALVTGALVVRWSLDGLLADSGRYGQSFDFRVHLPEDPTAELAVLGADSRVADLSVTRQGAINLAGRAGTTIQIATTSVEPVTGQPPVAVLDGRLVLDEGEIALAGATMHALGLRVGDRTTARGECGSLDVVVVGRVIVPLTSSNFPDNGSIVTHAGYDTLCADRSVADLDVNQSALVRLRDSADIEAVRGEWAAAGLRLSDPEVPNAVTLIRDLRPVPLVIGGVVALLAAAAAAHALVLTVRHRRRDLAVLRSFGLRPRDAGGVIRCQAAVLALAAAVIGIPLGVVLGRLVWSAIAGPSHLLVRPELRLVGVAVLLLGMGAVAMAAAVWPAHQAARMRPAEALRSE